MALGAIFVGFWFTQESRPSVILNHRLDRVREITGFDALTCDESSKIPDIRTFVTTMVSRPIRFFFTEPIVCTVSIMSATIFGSVYLQTEGIKVIYRSFGFDERQSALPLISWNVGLILTVPFRIYDWKFVSYRLRKGHAIRPEDKMTGFYVAAPVLAVSLWWLSWTIPPDVRHCAELCVLQVLLTTLRPIEFRLLYRSLLSHSSAAVLMSSTALCKAILQTLTRTTLHRQTPRWHVSVAS